MTVAELGSDPSFQENPLEFASWAGLLQPLRESGLGREAELDKVHGGSDLGGTPALRNGPILGLAQARGSLQPGLAEQLKRKVKSNKGRVPLGGRGRRGRSVSPALSPKKMFGCHKTNKAKPPERSTQLTQGLPLPKAPAGVDLGMTDGIILVKPVQRRDAPCGEGLPQQSAARLGENPGLGTHGEGTSALSTCPGHQGASWGGHSSPGCPPGGFGPRGFAFLCEPKLERMLVVIVLLLIAIAVVALWPTG
ncbi:hypothetical protein IHE44_0006706 [Lamprotornis superbus]|uniref:Uncharacterized protein n=1 Tax=Lamprotornis superbus TaxID=245042 RepID=A0A835TPB9_9PASS|nr:hypothetical protein IHE44_0006706 [Lamprotornis superbus]